MLSAWEAVFFIRQCFEAFNDALRGAEVASSSQPPKRWPRRAATGVIPLIESTTTSIRRAKANLTLTPLRKSFAKVLEACKRLLPRSSQH